MNEGPGYVDPRAAQRRFALPRATLAARISAWATAPEPGGIGERILRGHRIHRVAGSLSLLTCQSSRCVGRDVRDGAGGRFDQCPSRLHRSARAELLNDGGPSDYRCRR